MMPGRAAKSLVEILVVLAVAGMLMTLTGRTLFLLMRAHGQATQAMTAQTTLFRLARQLRADVDRAGNAELQESGVLKLAPAPGRAVITYRPREDRVIRLVRREEEIVRREPFRLPDGANRFELERIRSEGAGGSLVTLIHRRHTGPRTSPEAAPSREYRIEAVWRPEDGLQRKLLEPR